MPSANTQAANPALPFWLLILSGGMIVAIATGRGQSMGLYQLPMVAELKIGREPFSTAMAMAQLMTGLGAPFSGALMDKLGAFRVVLGCVLLTVAGLYCLQRDCGPVGAIGLCRQRGHHRLRRRVRGVDQS